VTKTEKIATLWRQEANLWHEVASNDLQSSLKVGGGSPTWNEAEGRGPTPYVLDLDRLRDRGSTLRTILNGIAAF
jgi:hypothetical protein